jgi:hypothetical protein
MPSPRSTPTLVTTTCESAPFMARSTPELSPGANSLPWCRARAASATFAGNCGSIDKGVFTSRDPKKIARSLKRSAERSKRRKADPYRSALSMLNFYINRAGKNLPASRKKVLQRAKSELRDQFGRA